jgi:hypothetical protein
MRSIVSTDGEHAANQNGGKHLNAAVQSFSGAVISKIVVMTVAKSPHRPVLENAITLKPAPTRLHVTSGPRHCLGESNGNCSHKSLS